MLPEQQNHRGFLGAIAGLEGRTLLPLNLKMLRAAVRVDFLFGEVVCASTGNNERTPADPKGVLGRVP
jgi:hypothetical protein